ncbi:hypothetical protein BBK82_36655 [Lentzea guizhouensis]|uniref:Uncharacterized protein n=1 Tax=Lentzea guizhouensis TaxID=1586287 RepID=A0A1B2HSN6_9PSEU|nr:hypothetical protein [Lentzea guizhouensis]ANZ40708.1 hypothetical protein BBK82_36655 [Lentzea guizhouensis]
MHEHLVTALRSRGLPLPEQRNTRTISKLALARNAGRVDPVGTALLTEARRLRRAGETDAALTKYRAAAEAGNPVAAPEWEQLLSATGQRSLAALMSRKHAEDGDVAAMTRLVWPCGGPVTSTRPNAGRGGGFGRSPQEPDHAAGPAPRPA